MTDNEVYGRARDVAAAENDLRNGILGNAPQGDNFEIIRDSYYEGAIWALKVARQEERENAVKQLQIVLTAIVARNDSKINFGDIIDQFTELINQ